MAPHWADTVGQWRARNATLRVMVDDAPAPSPADEYMLYQTLVGAWPPGLAPDDARGLDAFLERVAQWQRKALREAKRRSRWSRPNEPYEDACERFLAALLAPGNDFASALHAFVQRIAAAGAANGLLQATLRLTTPGVPDIYQGTEYWDFSLVDPDNRRPVDFGARRASLAAGASWDAVLRDWRRGPLKQRVLHELLQLRARQPALFARGAYHPLVVEADGQPCRPLLAFERRLDGASVVVLAARHHARVLLDAASPRWDAQATTALAGPCRVRGMTAGRYRNVLGGQEQALAEAMDPRDWLSPLPMAVLEQT
jgi:(1->4)-alpha-D-glucan 1-alpha-D-glucosylmutase